LYYLTKTKNVDPERFKNAATELKDYCGAKLFVEAHELASLNSLGP